MTYQDPPGIRCDGCRVAIDARLDVIEYGGRFFCGEECRREACLGEAEQLGLMEAK